MLVESNDIFFLSKKETKERSIKNLNGVKSRKQESSYYLYVSHHEANAKQKGSHNMSLTLSVEFMNDFGLSGSDYVLVGLINNLFVIKKSHSLEGWKISINKADNRGFGRVKFSHEMEYPLVVRKYNKSEVLLTSEFAYFEAVNKFDLDEIKWRCLNLVRKNPSLKQVLKDELQFYNAYKVSDLSHDSIGFFLETLKYLEEKEAKGE